MPDTAGRGTRDASLRSGQAAKDWTVEAVHALPGDGNRYELVDGELLVTPAPSWRHQDAVMALYQRLVPCCGRIGWDMSSLLLLTLSSIPVPWSNPTSSWSR